MAPKGSKKEKGQKSTTPESRADLAPKESRTAREKWDAKEYRTVDGKKLKDAKGIMIPPGDPGQVIPNEESEKPASPNTDPPEESRRKRKLLDKDSAISQTTTKKIKSTAEKAVPVLPIKPLLEIERHQHKLKKKNEQRREQKSNDTMKASCILYAVNKYHSELDEQRLITMLEDNPYPYEKKYGVAELKAALIQVQAELQVIKPLLDRYWDKAGKFFPIQRVQRPVSLASIAIDKWEKLGRPEAGNISMLVSICDKMKKDEEICELWKYNQMALAAVIFLSAFIGNPVSEKEFYTHVPKSSIRRIQNMLALLEYMQEARMRFLEPVWIDRGNGSLSKMDESFRVSRLLSLLRARSS
ncbi:hypothetical protein BJ508DRAFT_327947 [Ascobolus immersus RN42]|uniref:Uncharacterized protein n=1 Tax=Ascobolus immersus RN42 TaxID=1160509 RepID=A0A3N4I1B9_ASCIM|nr:hypothetical protein BJ508DRAFT_327947 [Ascobolus immersus RN42]